MAYKPGRKERGVAVSDAAGRVLGPEDPGVRAEMEAQRDREFGVVEQIGLAADMLPGGAIAAGGAKAAASGGRNIFKMINDSITGFKTGGAKAAKDAVLKWASSTDLTILTDAMNYLDGLSGKALAEIEPVRKAINEVYNQFSAPKGGFSLGAKPIDKETLSLGKDESTLEYIRRMRKKGVEASKKTTDILSPKDVASKVDEAATFASDYNSTIEDVMGMVRSMTDGDSKTLEQMLELTYKKLKDSGYSVGSTVEGPIQKGLHNLSMAIEAALGRGKPFSISRSDIMATKDLPAATRMSKDMPPLSGKSRIDKEGLEGLATSVRGFSEMTDDEIMYWLNYNYGRPPGNADAARRAKEAMALLMQEAKKRGLL